MIKIVFVCLGNICRSPSAEGIFREKVIESSLDNIIEIDSAGTSAFHVGELADSRMRKHASRRGYNLTSRSRQFKKSDFNEFDYIVVMDKQNYSDILNLDNNNRFKEKVKMMTDFSTSYFQEDVPDPYYGGPNGFDVVIDILEESCNGFLDFLKANEKI